MTDKCRRRMNGREGYIITEISQRMGDGQEGKGGPEKGRRLLCDREGLAHSRPRVRGPFSLGRWAARFCVLFTQKQVVASSKPNFLTHSLQIHCNGLGSKTVTL